MQKTHKIAFAQQQTMAVCCVRAIVFVCVSDTHLLRYFGCFIGCTASSRSMSVTTPYGCRYCVCLGFELWTGGQPISKSLLAAFETTIPSLNPACNIPNYDTIQTERQIANSNGLLRFDWISNNNRMQNVVHVVAFSCIARTNSH